MNVNHSSSTKFVLVVPCYNEASRLQLDDFAKGLEDDQRLRYCFVDDGSNDSTAQTLQDFASQYPDRCDWMSLERNCGKGEAVRHGIRRVLDADVFAIGYWDADLATPICEASRMADRMLADNQIDMVLGSRVRMLGHEIDREAKRHYFGRIFATFASLTLGLPVYDTQCGAKMLRHSAWLREVTEAPFQSRWVFDVELISRYLKVCERDARKPNLVEIPVRTWQDVAGSKVKISDAWKALFELWKISRQHRRTPAVRIDNDR